MSLLLGKGFPFDFRRTDGLGCAAGTTTNGSLSKNCSLLSSISTSKPKVRRTVVKVAFIGKRGLRVLAGKEDPKIGKWDQMELKFGRLIGEDPKFTLAKIMGRKANPEASYLEIEKSFYKNKGKIGENREVPFDVSKEKKSFNSTDGLNLVRPVQKKGFEFKPDDKPVVSKVRKPTQSERKMVNGGRKGMVPNVILRKPTVFNKDDVEDKRPRFKFKPNLSLKMWKEQGREKFSDITLLRKPEPEPGSSYLNISKKQESSYGNVEAKVHEDSIGLKRGEEDMIDCFPLLQKPKSKSVETQLGENKGQFKDAEMEVKTLDTEVEPNNTTENNFQELVEAKGGSVAQKREIEDNSIIGMQLHKQSNRGSTKEGIATVELSEKDLPGSGFSFSVEAALQGRPKRLDQSVREASSSIIEKAFSVSHEDNRNVASVSLLEDVDWSRVENLLKTGEWTEVELISSSNRAFVVSFGSLIGLLPYHNLSAKWRFLDFKTWLRQKGLDPAKYKQNLGVLGSYDVMCRNTSLDSSSDQKFMAEISPDTKLEDLLRSYDREKLKFLSSFVSQRIKVHVEMAERKSRKLRFSSKPKEKEELIKKRRNIMATLRVGDVVKCNVKQITDFGIFVEVEGVPALVHRTEVSWNENTLDPASFFKVGEILEAKVHQLDFSLERIFLSLKEMTPDPLVETLESVVGGHEKLDGRLEAAQADTEWADVESLIKELQQVEGIKSVSKGCFFLSPGLAPTFQVYMASMFENQYKLLARSGNKVQEVIVEASLSKEEMKSTILSCTNRGIVWLSS